MIPLLIETLDLGQFLSSPFVVAATWSESVSATSLVLLAILLIVACIAAWALNFIALPGNWLCVLLIALYGWLGPQEGRLSIGLGVVIGTFALALADCLQLLESEVKRTNPEIARFTSGTRLRETNSVPDVSQDINLPPIRKIHNTLGRRVRFDDRTQRFSCCC